MYFAKGTKSEADKPKPDLVNSIEETSNNETENEDASIYITMHDLETATDDSYFWLDIPVGNEITQMHIDDKWTADFQAIIDNRKISTPWNTGTSKSVIRKSCL